MKWPPSEGSLWCLSGVGCGLIGLMFILYGSRADVILGVLFYTVGAIHVGIGVLSDHYARWHR